MSTLDNIDQLRIDAEECMVALLHSSGMPKEQAWQVTLMLKKEDWKVCPLIRHFLESKDPHFQKDIQDSYDAAFWRYVNERSNEPTIYDHLLQDEGRV
jgi:hypothetical protein